MKVVTAQEMNLLDRRSAEEFSIPTAELMERAGVGLVEELERTWGPLSGKKIAVISGKGNNGGDGLVAARHLLDRSARPLVFLIAAPDAYRGPARDNLARFEKRAGPVPVLIEDMLPDLAARLAGCDLIIDALFGTGLSSPVAGLAAGVIDAINDSGKPVAAVDLPSGIQSDTGQVLGRAVKADLTVTFGLPKRGLLLLPGAEHAGRIAVADIGIPPALIERLPTRVRWLLPSEYAVLLKARPMDVHKGMFGHVLGVAGSTGKSGAAVLTGLAALRVGAGLVTLALPESLSADLPDRPPEIMTCPLPQTDEGTLGSAVLDRLLKLAQDKTVAAIGPGISTHPETVRLLHGLVRGLSIPMVIDADGLNCLAGHLEILKEARSPIVLTPHPGEMARLLGTSSQAVQSDRLGAAAELAGRCPATVVLKGARTVIAGRDGVLTINTTGNSGMATAGTGDVLTGMIAGLIAQGHPPDQAACLGVYLHGLAGDLAAAEVGEIGLLAGDLIRRIPTAIREGRSR